jgi:hypothetical protein
MKAAEASPSEHLQMAERSAPASGRDHLKPPGIASDALAVRTMLSNNLVERMSQASVQQAAQVRANQGAIVGFVVEVSVLSAG